MSKVKQYHYDRYRKIYSKYHNDWVTNKCPEPVHKLIPCVRYVEFNEDLVRPFTEEEFAQKVKEDAEFAKLIC